MSAASLVRVANTAEGQRVRNRYPIRPAFAVVIEERKRRGLSTRDLAALSGYSHNKIWRVEHGIQDAPLSYVEDVAQAMGLKIVVVEA